MSRDVIDELKRRLSGMVYEICIRETVKLIECLSFGQNLEAEDYKTLSKEVIRLTLVQLTGKAIKNLEKSSVIDGDKTVKPLKEKKAPSLVPYRNKKLKSSRPVKKQIA